MLENSFGVSFFLKSSKSHLRFIYLRITVDGVSKETSTKRKVDLSKWNQKTERSFGYSEEARSLNYFLDSLVAKINMFRTELINNSETLTSQKVIDLVKGNIPSKAKVLEEFQKHNDEVFSLIGKEYSKGTFDRYVTARSHVAEFIKYKYKTDDLEFRALNFEL